MPPEELIALSTGCGGRAGFEIIRKGPEMIENFVDIAWFGK
jgi:hypothetical protein